MQHREIYPLAGAPELVDQRLGVQLAVKGEKQRHVVSENYRRPGHHPLGGLLGKQALLLRAECASTIADLLANMLTGEQGIGLYSHAGLVTGWRNNRSKCNTGRLQPKTRMGDDAK